MFRSRYLGYLGRAFDLVREGGFRKLLWRAVPFVYERVYPYLPEGEAYGVYNGVVVGQKVGLLDTRLPEAFSKGDDPDYEMNYLSLIRRHVEVGDDVVIVGGGLGVSSVVAAKHAYKPGSVTTFEGSASAIAKTRKTIELNGVRERVELRHAIVGEGVKLKGESDGAPVIHPSDLPECDVLAIDCDGAETTILETVDSSPSLLIVEHHAVWNEGSVAFEYQPETVRRLIEGNGYEVIHEETMSGLADLHFYVARSA